MTRSAASRETATRETLIPVMVKCGKAHTHSKYRVHSEHQTFAEAAAVVHQLRHTDSIAWAYIPDEHADSATA